MFAPSLALLAFVAAAALSPGGATVLATASGARFGFRHSLPLIAGITLGLAALASLSALGLGLVIAAEPRLQLAMKIVGSCYIVFLAYRISTSGAPGSSGANRTEPVGVLGGAAMLFLNPKAWMVTLSASAAFSSPDLPPQSLALTLTLAFAGCGFASLSFWCVCGLLLARLLQSETQWHVVNALLALSLLASILPLWR